MAPCYTPGGWYHLMDGFGGRDMYQIVAVVNLGRMAHHGSLVLAISDKMLTVCVYVPADSLDVQFPDYAESLADGYRLLAARLGAYADGAREPAEIACRTAH